MNCLCILGVERLHSHNFSKHIKGHLPINSSPLTVFNLLKSTMKLIPLLSFIVTIMLTNLFSFSTAYIPVPLAALLDKASYSSPYMYIYTMQLSNANVTLNLHHFIFFISKHWKSLPSSVYPPSQNYNSCKR